MEEIETHLNTIEKWKTESVPLSKKDIVEELYKRTTPIFKSLLTTIQQQEQRISKLEEKIHQMKTKYMYNLILVVFKSRKYCENATMSNM